MKNKKLGDIIAVVAFLLVIFVIFAVISAVTGEEEQTTEADTLPEIETTLEVELPEIDTEPETPEGFTSADTDESPEDTNTLTLEDLEIGDTSWAYFIVNRTNPVPEGYEANIEFKEMWSNGRYYYIDARIADYAQCMINDAARDGVTLYLCSVYRTLASQTANFNNRLAAYAQANYSYPNAYTATARYIAVPNTSEHQTGLAIDFLTPEYMYLDEGFENTDAYKWLSENSYKYGFILRYPTDRSAETGINYEPWHFRFIGFEYAEDIFNSGLCLEEYMALDENVEFEPMKPLEIPAKPDWYDTYIPKQTEETTSDDTETEETESDETSAEDSADTESEQTDTEDTEADIFETEETDEIIEIDTEEVDTDLENDDTLDLTASDDTSDEITDETEETESDESDTSDTEQDPSADSEAVDTKPSEETEDTTASDTESEQETEVESDDESGRSDMDKIILARP